nr:MAG TPA: hypothetical protein [Caudoviricetes sp.]
MLFLFIYIFLYFFILYRIFIIVFHCFLSLCFYRIKHSH